MQIDLSVIVAMVGLALSLGTFFIGRATAIGKKGEQTGSLLSDIAYLKVNTDEIKSELREQRTFNNNAMVRIARCETQIDEISKRLDDHINQ